VGLVVVPGLFDFVDVLLILSPDLFKSSGFRSRRGGFVNPVRCEVKNDGVMVRLVSKKVLVRMVGEPLLPPRGSKKSI
jgi:hypothetical protein